MSMSSPPADIPIVFSKEEGLVWLWDIQDTLVSSQQYEHAKPQVMSKWAELGDDGVMLKTGAFGAVPTSAACQHVFVHMIRPLVRMDLNNQASTIIKMCYPDNNQNDHKNRMCLLGLGLASAIKWGSQSCFETFYRELLTCLSPSKAIKLTLDPKVGWNTSATCVAFNRMDWIKWLQENNGWDPLSLTKTGQTMIFPAMATPLPGHGGSEEKVPMLNFLVQQGVDINQAEPSGKTPLMWCAQRENCAADVCALLNAGADPEVKFSGVYRKKYEGMTTRDFMRNMHNQQAYETLLLWDAQQSKLGLINNLTSNQLLSPPKKM